MVQNESGTDLAHYTRCLFSPPLFLPEREGKLFLQKSETRHETRTLQYRQNYTCTMTSSTRSKLHTTVLHTMKNQMEISIQQNASTVGIVRPEFISTTLDWWPLETRAWGNSSVIHADLTHPNLIAAAKGLSPLFIRVGGSQADSAIYNMSTKSICPGM